jgi:hypothetical protein
MKRDLAIALITTILFSYSLASAKTVKNIDFSDSDTVGETKLILNGIGLRKKTVFKVDVYLAALYLETPSTDYKKVLQSNEIKEIQVVFLRDVTADDIVGSWSDGFKKNCKDQCKSLLPTLAKLNALMEDVKKGQKFTFHFFPDRFDIEKPDQGPKALEGGTFAKVVLATFIGEEPPTIDLRDQMLNLKPLKEN